jgi:hypothetical protein
MNAAQALTYPLDPPAIGSSVALADGVTWIRLPLPYKLNHINVWALEDAGGWTLVDTGVRGEETTALLHGPSCVRTGCWPSRSNV